NVCRNCGKLKKHCRTFAAVAASLKSIAERLLQLQILFRKWSEGFLRRWISRITYYAVGLHYASY
ncbi:MAG: hypothetical protein LBS79_02700, partial [Tannerella sp.]|nr:hypothetical protein [Tannerella sp.]